MKLDATLGGIPDITEDEAKIIKLLRSISEKQRDYQLLVLNADDLEQKLLSMGTLAETIGGIWSGLVGQVQTLKSDVLASAITENPAVVRTLGKSDQVLLNPVAFIAITGNGLVLSEDLARRFMTVELDAGMEDPEGRPFKGDLVADILARRGELLRAVLTIWRWGRMNAGSLTACRAMGSFDAWGRWCRDPLVTLGCADPAVRASEAKANDPRRRAIAELFRVWWEEHGNAPMTLVNLAEPVKDVADPQKKGRQFLAATIRKLERTRLGGFILTRYDHPNANKGDQYRLLKLRKDTPEDRMGRQNTQNRPEHPQASPEHPSKLTTIPRKRGKSPGGGQAEQRAVTSSGRLGTISAAVAPRRAPR